MHACIRKAFVESREVYLQNNDPPGRGGGARGVGLVVWVRASTNQKKIPSFIPSLK